MKLTAKARAAVTAMADIAAHGAGAPVPLSDVARRQALSVRFLEQVFAQLRRAGLVESRRGAKGGYVLVRAPGEVSLAEVVAAVDETVRTTACRAGTTCTGSAARCLTHGLWRELDGHIEGFLASRTLAHVARRASTEDVAQRASSKDVAQRGGSKDVARGASTNDLAQRASLQDAAEGAR